MMAMSQTARILEGELNGSDVEFDHVAIDTRSLQPGSVYFAIKGDRFDGHDFLQQAKEAGAVGAVVERFSELNLTQIKVTDTRKALGNLAANWRKQFKGLVVGITGSNGKTTVKEMIAAIFAKQGDVLATRGNFNNDIGLPLTLLSVEKNHDFAVIEMGANHKGEIDELTHITKPDIAVITNAGSAHLEGFGSRQGIAEAKGEIFSGLSGKGVAVINVDDDYADYWVDLCKAKKIIRFSLANNTADVTGEWQSICDGGKLKVHTESGDIEITLKVPGRHNAMNALAAIAVAMAANISLQNIKQALDEFESVKGRLDIHATDSGVKIIDDTYNANPESLLAGLDVLMGMPGKHWLVLGDMGELGSYSGQLHKDVGLTAKQMGVDCLYAVGEDNKAAVEMFGQGGRHFSDQNALINYLTKTMCGDLNILVKGSRFMQMEKVVDALIKGDKSCC
ncbi:MAG: UDP-N-acetylmuramoyl-tripeptide--D-alanyl-D-alanine ligase [Gammaproteobacteria bacterium]|nr:UDP-N-acetylmuramoyl-tripeptide--D-alanyl-D-alanine ligase [Gammaproteobacteria bacterium]MCW8910563.1 UDP-N-acetylmuramoyl-tripeptide--D-alanyl-D-alanine ligase [Gammaproteobacteria bacterium]MCW9005407.1 UDP-N-acetylmuramoyl-tripeptide--D-alanyl-D-alanine ligase [Gammaproteobacteria bacterium]MCW9055245.1 UDP-N-acetylmuramoyl-tripeptide--D-alanyl-D-alanine ligase [Gammaproteobacteria bacterium]